jgi:hypothetical protein
MEKQVLTDPMVKPESNILEAVLGKKYKLFNDFVERINGKDLILEWNYYNDGKSWLCKILNNKKNICWLSIWNTGFKLTFYFTEKTINGLFELEINDAIKKGATEIKYVGKLIPVILSIKNKGLMEDGIKILDYKRAFK